jgi:signal transduction histidine kinase
MQAMLNCLELIQEETVIDCVEAEILTPLLENCPLRDKLISAKKEVHELIEDGIDRAKYCVKVLNSLSEYSKIATDKTIYIIDVVTELNTIIKTLRFIDQFKSLSKEQFELLVSSEDIHCLVKINRVDFSQLITNLCRNAREAISHDKPEIHIQVECKESNVLIKVVDNGRGIDPSLGDKIFEPYFSTKSNPDSYNQGLGLAMVRDIVLAYGGSVDYNSVPGRTEFIISFSCEH